VYTWKLYDLSLEPDFSGALAVDDASKQLRAWTVTSHIVSRLLTA
jgi:hypothetical protein